MRQLISTAINNIDWHKEPYNLYEPIEYILSIGGKRIRPQLVLIGCQLFSDDVTAAIPAAIGIEVFHNFTLLHDDLMDKADMRRGKMTVHKKWDNNTAILSGDAMMIEAYKFMSQVPEKHLKESMELFSNMALEICEGQQYDMDFESRTNVSASEYLNMIRLKTAVLLGTSLKIGALIGGANKKDADLLYDFGIDAGMAFQLQDDILDVYGDPNMFGKNIGGDIVSNKKTYMLIMAFQEAEGDKLKELEKWVSLKEFSNEEKIKAVTTLYDTLNIRRICEKKMYEYMDAAISVLDKINIEDSKKECLEELIHQLTSRNL